MNTNNENKEYQLINLEFEYPGINGGVKWAVISDLPMEELMRKYGDELEHYSPVILLTVEQGEAFREFHKNDKKHEMRRIRTHELLGFSDGWLEENYINRMSVDFSDDMEEIIDYHCLRDFIENLPEPQKRRCKLYFYYGFSEAEIAQIDGVEQSSVSRALSCAVKKLKKFF